MTAVSEALRLVIQEINSGQLGQAEKLCRQILKTGATHPDAWHLLGVITHKKGKPDEALTFVKKALEDNPHSPDYHYNLGIIFSALGKFEDAISAYQDSLYLKPGHADALNNLGLLLYDLDRFEESIILFQQSIRANPNLTNARYNLGMALQAQGRPEEAIDAYNQVLKVIPGSAETRFNQSLSLLLIGNFEDGWAQYEWRFKKTEPKSKSGAAGGLVRWNGGSFAGKRLLVLDEQGFGDTLQFIRYLPLVKERGGSVIFETVKPLMSLLSGFNGIDRLVDRSAEVNGRTEFDLYIPLMSLPGIFNTRLETIPANVPYVLPDNSKVHHWAFRLKTGRFKIGIVWSGKTSQDYRQTTTSGLEHVRLEWTGRPASKFASDRLTRLEYFAPIATVPGIQLYGLQKGKAALETQKISGMLNLINLGEEFKDFSDTTAVIANLDLVITVDTAVAHLAGAMGKPVWVLIPYVPDWRWMLDREDSPWYPTMRLFRQQKRGDWGDVFHQIAHELHLLVHQ